MVKEVKKVTKRPGKWRRSYKACLSCRAKKVRCDLGPFDNPHPPPCIRCKREQRECLFTTKNGESSLIVSEGVSPIADSVISTMSNSSVMTPHNSATNNMVTTPTIVDMPSPSIREAKIHTETNDRTQRHHNMSVANITINENNIRVSGNNLATNNKLSAKESRRLSSNKYLPKEIKQINGKWGVGVTSMQNTLEFLANAAGTVAHEKSKVNYEVRKSKLSADETRPEIFHEREMSSRPTPFLDPSDENIFAPLLETSGSQRPVSTLMEKIRSVRPTSPNKLSEVDYIGPGKLLSELEAIELIDAFFLSMHPYFPNIPIQLHDAQELAEYPILLCAILTVSSRYHTFTEFGLSNGADNKRNIDVHENLWTHCQWMLSQTIWAEASTRSIGTVLAFIILTEWNPRQIHFKKTDYANKNSEKTNKEIPTGVGAIRRSDRMAWMFTGSAVRLAQDMGFIETSTKIFVATHISDTFSSINLNQRPVLADTFNATSLGMNNVRVSGYRTEQNNEGDGDIGNEKFFLDAILKNDDTKERWKNILINSGNNMDEQDCPLTDLEREFLNDEYVLYYSNRGEDIYEQHTPLPFALNFSHAQRAKIELVRITLVAYETIYYDQGKKKMSTNDQEHNLAILDILSPLMDGWYGNYRDLLKPTSELPYDINIRKNKRAVYQLSKNINRESILSDYYYCQLYVYSLALQADNKENSSGKLRINEIIKSAKYVELAYIAASEILQSASRVHKIKMLKYMPVRWVVRIVRSVSFMVKCYLTLTTNSGTQRNNSQSILKLCCISLDETINSIRMAALILKEATPDELHLCVRYSAILLYLCKELKLKKKRNQELLVSRGIIVNEGIGTNENRLKIPNSGTTTNETMSTNANRMRNSNTHIEANRTEELNYRNSNANSSKNVIPHYNEILNSTENARNSNIAINNLNVNPNTTNNIKNDHTNLDSNNFRDISGYQVSPEPDNTSSNFSNNNNNISFSNNNTEENGLSSHGNAIPQDNAGYFQSLPDQVIDWFAVRDDIGLDFVEPWTQMIEQQYLQSNYDIFSDLENQPF